MVTIAEQAPFEGQHWSIEIVFQLKPLQACSIWPLYTSDVLTL